MDMHKERILLLKIVDIILSSKIFMSGCVIADCLFELSLQNLAHQEGQTVCLKKNPYS